MTSPQNGVQFDRADSRGFAPDMSVRFMDSTVLRGSKWGPSCIVEDSFCVWRTGRRGVTPGRWHNHRSNINTLPLDSKARTTMSTNRVWDILGRLGVGKKSSSKRNKHSDWPFGRSLQMEQLETRELLSVTGSISGSVFADSDADGFFDANESGLENWTVELQGVGGEATELGVLYDPLLALENRFANAVATYGDDVLIASPNSQPGMVLRYTDDGELVGVFADPTDGGTFGASLAVFDHYLVVGDPNETVSDVGGDVDNAGAVYVYDLEAAPGADPHVHTFHKATGTRRENDLFGYSVAALNIADPDDDEIFIGAPGDDVSDGGE